MIPVSSRTSCLLTASAVYSNGRIASIGTAATVSWLSANPSRNYALYLFPHDIIRAGFLFPARLTPLEAYLNFLTKMHREPDFLDTA